MDGVGIRVTQMPAALRSLWEKIGNEVTTEVGAWVVNREISTEGDNTGSLKGPLPLKQQRKKESKKSKE